MSQTKTTTKMWLSYSLYDVLYMGVANITKKHSQHIVGGPGNKLFADEAIKCSHY